MLDSSACSQTWVKISVPNPKAFPRGQTLTQLGLGSISNSLQCWGIWKISRGSCLSSHHIGRICSIPKFDRWCSVLIIYNSSTDKILLNLHCMTHEKKKQIKIELSLEMTPCSPRTFPLGYLRLPC